MYTVVTIVAIVVVLNLLGRIPAVVQWLSDYRMSVQPREDPTED